jgi:signal peptidase I
MLSYIKNGLRMIWKNINQWRKCINLVSSSLRKGALTILIFLLVGLLIRVFLLEFYEISSSSMEPTLIKGDIVIVFKINYGARILNPIVLFFQKKVKYVRTKGFRALKKGDILVFNLPLYNNYLDSTANNYGDCIIKRTLGLPGESVLINHEKIVEGAVELNNRGILFPFAENLNWSLSNYGPISVPKKGEIIELTRKNIIWYNEVLLYENPNGYIKDSTLFIEDKVVRLYAFKHNYYFMLGDNFFNSQDSRYWGFLPDENIIGKATIILFSINRSQQGFKKIRPTRFMKII